MEAYSSTGKDRVATLISNIIQTKMSLAVGYASRASIYDSVLTAYELSTAQCIVLALLHGLVNSDVAVCSLLGSVSTNVQHLRSSYLKVWLRDDFHFDSNEIYRAFTTASHFINAGLICIPVHVLQILASIADIYSVVERCGEEGDKDTLSLLESLGVGIKSTNTSEDDSPAATAKVYSEEETVQSPEQETVQSPEEETVQSPEEETVQSPEEETVQSPEQETVQSPAEAVTREEPSSPEQLGEEDNAFVNIEPVQFLEEEIEFVAPFQNFIDEEEESDLYDIDDIDDDYEDYDTTDFDDEFDQLSPDSDTEIESDNELTLEMSTLNVVIALAQEFTESGYPGNELAQQQVDENGKTLLHKAAEQGNVRGVRALLRLGMEVDCHDNWLRTPAHIAATGGKLRTLRELFYHGGANLHSRDNRGDTMLHSAADRGHTEVVRWLIRHEVRADVSGRGGWRPLHRASQQGHLDTVRLLIDKGACPNMMADVGGTPLHRAAWWNKLEVAHFLIARGADVDAVDNRSDTPLHMAAKLGHLEMVKLLLDCGADPSLEDRSCMTPHDWAERNRRTDIVEYMHSIGAAY